jgi:hypothetical protein
MSSWIPLVPSTRRSAKTAGSAPLMILSTKYGAPKQIGKVLSTSASALHLQEFRELADGPCPVISEELLPGEQ